MKIGTQQAHGQEKFGRQKDDKDCPKEGQAPGMKLPHRQDNPQCSTAISDKVHDNNGVQLHGEDFHGNFAEAFGLLVHLLMLVGIRLINFEGGKPLQVFQKRIAQGGILTPVFPQKLLGKTLHCHNGNGDQRDAEKQNNCTGQTDKAQDRKQGQRRKDCVAQLRQIRPKVHLQLINALYRQLDHLRGSGFLLIRQAQSQQFFVNHGAQPFLYLPGSAVACPAGQGRAQISDGQGGQQDPNGVFPPCQVGPGGKLAQKKGNSAHQPNVAKQRNPLEQHLYQHIFFAPAHHVHQPLIEHRFRLHSVSDS